MAHSFYNNESEQQRKSKKETTCNQKNCYLCTYGVDKEFQTEFYQKGWHRRVVPIFVYLEKTHGRLWHNLITDIFPFVQQHWNLFWPNGTSESIYDKGWKESLKALISRKKCIFESGRQEFRTRGYWRLRPSVNRQLYTSYNSTKETPSSNEFVLWNPDNVDNAQEKTNCSFQSLQDNEFTKDFEKFLKFHKIK